MINDKGWSCVLCTAVLLCGVVPGKKEQRDVEISA